MAVSPWYQGMTAIPAVLTIKDDSGNPLVLTGATITSVLRTANGVDQTMTGTWSIINPATGIAQYVWSSADVATPGNYNIIVTATFSTKPAVVDPIPFLLLPV
jgi:hypothetical protein